MWEEMGMAVKLAVRIVTLLVNPFVMPAFPMVIVIVIMFILIAVTLTLVMANPGILGPTGPIPRHTNITLNLRITKSTLMWSGVFGSMMNPIPARTKLRRRFAPKYHLGFANRGGTRMMKMVMAPPGRWSPRALLAFGVWAQDVPDKGLPRRRLVSEGPAPAIPSLTIAILAPARRAVLRNFLY